MDAGAGCGGYLPADLRGILSDHKPEPDTMSDEKANEILQELRDLKKQVADLINDKVLPPDHVFDIEGAAAYMGISKNTLYFMRSRTKDGPPSSGKKYIKKKIDEWMETKDLDALGLAERKRARG